MTHPMATAEAFRWQSLRAGILVILLLTLGSCSSEGGSAEVATTTTIQASDGKGSAGEEETSATEPDDGGEGSEGTYETLDLPRTVAYAGLEWTVEDVSVAPPSKDEDDEKAEGSPVEVLVSFTVQNTLEGIYVTVPSSMLALADDDAIISRAERFEGTESSSRVRVDSGQSVTGTAVFEADAPPTTKDLAFVIDEEQQVPARLPLIGELPVDDAPTGHFVDPTVSAPLLFPSGVLDDHATIQPLDVTWALDWQADRASLDTHFVVTSVRVSAAPKNRISLYFNDDDARLLVDGVARKPEFVRGDTRPKPGTSVDLDLVFEVPDDAETLALAAGDEGTTDVTWTIELGS